MDVLIKGMKMPKHCWQCAFKDFADNCDVMYAIGRENISVDESWGKGSVPNDCPLIELPDHGDLIDRDALKDKAEFIGDAFSGRGGYVVWGTDMLNAPAVILAERSEE